MYLFMCAPGRLQPRLPGGTPTANLPTTIMDFGGFDSSIILILRGGNPRPIGDFPESLTQAILVGIMLGGTLGVLVRSCDCRSRESSSAGKR